MTRSKGGLKEEIDRLFTLDPSAFIAARDELAKRLKAGGRAEGSSEVGRLRRPTVAAWAANQVARRHHAEVEELLAAGAELRVLQRALLSGMPASGFREAMDRRRRAAGKLTRAAERLLKESGHSTPGLAEAVGATLEAASLDEVSAELVRAGRLSKELAAPSGFGGVESLELVSGVPEEPPGKGARGKDGERAPARKAAEREAKELANAAAHARHLAIKARATADRAKAQAERLRRQADEAMTQAREAADAARAAEKRADRARAEAERAARKVEQPGS